MTAPTVTATAPEATVTEDAVTATSEAVTVTPPAVTVTPPRVTETAPEVTITGAAGDPESEAGTALGALSSLPVKAKAGNGGYDRDEFGSPWSDATSTHGSRNGCDTRNDVLRRDLDGLVVEPGTAGCVAQTGTLSDPYSGDQMPFVRGEDSASGIHIDHVVSLSDAWQTGAQQLSEDGREHLANDPLNPAVDGSLNQSNGDGDAATWLPPNEAIRCDLVAQQVAVKGVYRLWVTTAEADAVSRVLGACPDEVLPTIAQWVTPATS
ncbi:MAG: HNH endonuclease family protein [Ornithinimicrobium sp.]